MSAFSGVGMVAVGVGMNAAKDITRKHDPLPTLLGGAMLGFAVSMVSGFVDARLGTALAALFLLGSFMASGVVLFDIATNILSSRKA